MNIKKEAIRKIRDATDRNGGTSFPPFMMDNMKQWEREGLVEIDLTGSGLSNVTITQKGRKYAE